MSISRVFLAPLLAALLAGVLPGCACMCGKPADANHFAKWQRGPSESPDFFPIAVWLQDPADAPAYKAAGINTYVGLWEGPTDQQLADLASAGMPVFCGQNAVGLKHINDPIIVGWMHGDEPDNAQSSPGKDAAGKPLPNQPIPPANVIAEYNKFRANDPTRPIMLNLGQGVANDTWKGRGKDNGNLEVYKQYVKAGDIISFDIYPVSGNHNPDRGNLSQDAKGIKRLISWSGGKKIIWNCIECTQINSDRPDKITPEQMQECVWISLIHGSTGIIYFCHQFGSKGASPKHLLLDPPMLAAATQVNHEIKELAPVLNSPTLSDVATVTPAAADATVDIMVKKHAGSTYIFASGMTRKDAHATFHVNGLPAAATAEVLDESRTIPIVNGDFQDDFAPFGIHRYMIKPAP